MVRVDDFLRKCWYGCNVVIVNYHNADIVSLIHFNSDIDAIKEKASYVGTTYELKDEKVLKSYIESFGVIDGYLVIETY